MDGPAAACAVAEEHSDGAGGKTGRWGNPANKVRRRSPGVAAVDGAVHNPGREPESCPSDLRKNDGAGVDAVGIPAYGPSSASVWPLSITAVGVSGGWMLRRLPLRLFRMRLRRGILDRLWTLHWGRLSNGTT